MRIALIAALTPFRVIGKNNQLPWQMPADLAYFRKTTLNKPVIMGRKTFESIGRPLPHRENIVITSQNNKINKNNIKIFSAVEKAVNYLKKNLDNTEIFGIGGTGIFKEMLAMADRLYLTFIHANIEGDVFFPAWNPDEWQEISREDHLKDQHNPYHYSFVIFERTCKKPVSKAG